MLDDVGALVLDDGEKISYCPGALPLYYVYMLANRNNNVLYTGVTNDLNRRLYEHKHGLVESFTQKYKVHKLVYFDSTADVYAAISREKQIKGWARAKKNSLVEEMNPDWHDLSKDWE